MDLGQVKVRSQGGNVLTQALHRHNGLVWTDGVAVYLSPVSLLDNTLEQLQHYKLGEFDRGVWSVHWSDNISIDVCFLCVVHDKNISIWRVDGQQPKLSFKQVRKINIQPIPQGCLWGPGKDVLCVLCAHQCSLYYSHQTNKGSHVLLQFDRSKIRCGCWVTDSSKLVICVDTTIMVYQWSDINKSVTPDTTVHWTVPGLIGCISSIVPVSDRRVLLAAELPLESLCTQQDTFVLPDVINSNSLQPDVQHQDTLIIRPGANTTSLTNTLFNLPRNPQAVVEDFCKLNCIELQNNSEPCVVASCEVKGLLKPDILLYHGHQKVAVVGSHTQNVLQVFNIDKNNITKTGDINLSKDERSKGICCFTNNTKDDADGILVLVGKTSASDSAFLSSTKMISIKCSLKFFTVKPEPYMTPVTNKPSVQLKPTSGDPCDGRPTNSVQKDNVDPQSARISGNMSDGKSSTNISDTTSTSQFNSFEPPKRPVRRKKSMQKKQHLIQTSSNSGESCESVEKMPMEKMPMDCMSDSSECSPRDQHILSRVSGFVERTVGESTPDTTASQHLGTKQDSYNTFLHTFHSTNDTDTEINTHTLKLPSHNTKPSGIHIVELGEERDTSGHIEGQSDDAKKEHNYIDLNKEEAHNTQQSEKTNRLLAEQHGDMKSGQHCTEPSGQLRSMVAETDQSGENKNENAISIDNSPRNRSDSIISRTSIESLDDIDSMLQEQNKQILQLQDEIKSLSRRVDDSSSVLLTRYQSITQPDVIQLCFLCKDGSEMKKKFILDNGRLKLEPVKQAFSLSTLELLIDGDWCVTGDNIDGYIPLRFDSNSTVYVNGNAV